jgi:hypothetical protein
MNMGASGWAFFSVRQQERRQQQPLDHAGCQVVAHALDAHQRAPGMRRAVSSPQANGTSGSAWPCSTSVGTVMRASSCARVVSATMASIWRMVPTGW